MSNITIATAPIATITTATRFLECIKIDENI